MKKSIQELAANVLDYVAQRSGIDVYEQGKDEHESESLVEAQRSRELATLHKTIAQCQECQLCTTRTQAVPGSGSCGARVFIVGEAPGFEEDRRGKPFVGASGNYLDKWLTAISLDRARDVFISNVVKCRPPDNRNPHIGEIQSCMPYLHTQIALVRPKTVLALGRFAAHTLLDTQESIRRLRMTTHNYKDIPVVVSYHPSAVLRNPSLRKQVWEDLQKLQKLL